MATEFAPRSVLDDLERRSDPVRLFEQAVGAPDVWQRDVLRSDARRVLLNCSRQVGKSTTVATLAVHCALYEPGATILIQTPGLRQSQLAFRACLRVYRALGRPLPADAESAQRLELSNGASITALPGTAATTRGFSAVHTLFFDEASRVSDETYFSMRPVLATSGGRIIAASTPFGTRGWWYEAWRSVEPWQRVEVPASACRRISPEFLAEEARSLGAWWYQREYCCSFQEDQTQAFRHEDVEAAFAEEVTPWRLRTSISA